MKLREMGGVCELTAVNVTTLGIPVAVLYWLSPLPRNSSADILLLCWI